MTNQKLPIILIADNIRSLYNVGSLFRLADAVNIEAIYLCGLTGYPKIKHDTRPTWVAERADKEIRKTGLSGVETVPFRYFPEVADAIKAVKGHGYQVIALELILESKDYREASYHFPLAILIGHETEGIDSSGLASADEIVHLPMKGRGKSLNVATAVGVILYYLSEYHERIKG